MSKRLRFIVLISIFLLGALVLYPTFEWYFVLSSEQKTQSAGTREEIRNIAIEQADEKTQSFVKMLNGVEPDKYAEDFKTDDGLVFLYEEAKDRKKEKKEKLNEISAKEIGSAYKSQNDVYESLLDFYRMKIQDIKNKKDKIINLGLDLSGGVSAVLQVNMQDLEEKLGSKPSDSDVSEAISRAIFVLQNRIDKFGVSEPRIRKQGSDSIRIEIPGDNDRERIQGFIQGKGAMSFRIVNTEVNNTLRQVQQDNPAWIYNKENPPNYIPAGTEVLEYVKRDEFGIEQHVLWLAVYKDIDSYGIDGSHLVQAQVSINTTTNKPDVNFQLDGEGAQKLAKLSNEYQNQSMAIVLDDKVQAYAQLTAVINNGQARISGFDKKTAQDISTILQTAALPVELEIVDQRVVGPSLGQAVIDAGLKAIIIGFILVIIFMVMYYKGSGIIAVVGLLCNMYLLLSLLSAFNFTITLTGIAGIILTVGMAVDSNVLIFERIKEELALGKSRRMAIETGFKRAFWSIVDANITTFIAAFFISQIASGPIQGFAVTLSIGIITTLFTSLFITRLLFDFSTEVFKKNTVSISWRKL